MSLVQLYAGIIGQEPCWYWFVRCCYCVFLYSEKSLEKCYISVPTILFAVPLPVIIISDCLCQQWLDTTHKVTNPIKLIIQVLNYTRKHSYPERRSAFTYIDEEQPTRMDYGKEKFGGPFTEEEVEDVKTVLRLLPLVICLSLQCFSFRMLVLDVYLFKDDHQSYCFKCHFGMQLYQLAVPYNTDSTLPAPIVPMFSHL